MRCRICGADLIEVTHAGDGGVIQNDFIHPDALEFDAERWGEVVSHLVTIYKAFDFSGRQVGVRGFSKITCFLNPNEFD